MRNAHRPADVGRFSADDEVLYHLGSLLDSVQTAIISLDGEGRVRVFNAGAESLFDISRQWVLGRSFSSVGRVSAFSDSGARALWERLSDAVWAAGAALNLEYDLIRARGQKRVILYSVYPLGKLPWSVGNGVVIMLDDITRKKEMEELILEGRKRLQTVFDGITDGIQVIDRDFQITAVNRSMTALIGCKVAIGSHCYQSCGSTTTVCDDCPGVETFRSGRPSSVIKRIKISNSSGVAKGEQILEISTFPLLNRGNRVTQIVEYIKDVTERVSFAERLEHARRLAAIGEMAARVAHEVRNPLNAITGAAHYLSTEYPNDEVIQKFTELIKRQSLRVDQVASDVLHAARPLRLNRSNVDIDAVLEQAVHSFEGRMREQGIKLDLRRSAVPMHVHADEVQLEQAMVNILKNAIEAMPTGGALLVTTESEETGWFKILVEDSGHGIPPEEHEKVFSAFYTTKAHGTGLGLSIVEGVLKNHGGSISIEQPEHRGTRVVVRLPLGGLSKSQMSATSRQCDGSITSSVSRGQAKL